MKNSVRGSRFFNEMFHEKFNENKRLRPYNFLKEIYVRGVQICHNESHFLRNVTGMQLKYGEINLKLGRNRG